MRWKTVTNTYMSYCTVSFAATEPMTQKICYSFENVHCLSKWKRNKPSLQFQQKKRMRTQSLLQLIMHKLSASFCVETQNSYAVLDGFSTPLFPHKHQANSYPLTSEWQNFFQPLTNLFSLWHLQVISEVLHKNIQETEDRSVDFRLPFLFFWSHKRAAISWPAKNHSCCSSSAKASSFLAVFQVGVENTMDRPEPEKAIVTVRKFCFFSLAFLIHLRTFSFNFVGGGVVHGSKWNDRKRMFKVRH